MVGLICFFILVLVLSNPDFSRGKIPRLYRGGVGRGVGVVLGVAVILGVDVAVAVAVGVADTVGVGLGVSGHRLPEQLKISIESKRVTPSDP